MTVQGRLATSLLALLLLFPAAASSQSVNGAITGVIKDPSGGVVADVALTLRNVATNQTIATAVSGSGGEYAFRNLPPGQVRGRGGQERLPAGHASRHRRDAELGPARRHHAAHRDAGDRRRGDRRLLGTQRDGHAGARDLAGNAQPAAAADEQRPARGGLASPR